MQSLYNATFHVKTWLPPARPPFRSQRSCKQGRRPIYLFFTARASKGEGLDLAIKIKPLPTPFFPQCANTRAIERTKKLQPTKTQTPASLLIGERERIERKKRGKNTYK